MTRLSANDWLDRYGPRVGVMLCLLGGVAIEGGQVFGNRVFVDGLLVLSVPLLYIAGVVISSSAIVVALVGGLGFGLLLSLGVTATRSSFLFSQSADGISLIVVGIVVNLIFGIVPVLIGAISGVIQHRTLVVILLLVDQLVSALVLDLWRGSPGHAGGAALLGVGLVVTLAATLGDRIRTVFGTGVIIGAGFLVEVSYLLLSQAVVVPS